MGLTEKVEKLAVKARYCPVPGGFNSRCYHSRFWESAVRKDRLLTSLLGVALVISFSATVLETVVYAVEGDVWRINISLLVYTAFSALLLLYLTTAFILKQVVLAMQGIDSGIIAKHDPTLVQVLRENRAVWADSGLSHREILTRLYCYQPFDTELEDVIDASLSSRLQDVLVFSTRRIHLWLMKRRFLHIIMFICFYSFLAFLIYSQITAWGDFLNDFTYM